MKPMQNIVCFRTGEGRLRRYMVDWLGNLKFMGEAEVIPPQADDFADSVEQYRRGVPVVADMEPRAA